MSYLTAELLGRVERRRRFSVEQKLAILTEATAPGANLSEVARRHGLLPAQVYKWRRLAELGVIGVPGASELPSFVAVEITKDVPPLPAPIPEDKPASVNDGRGATTRPFSYGGSWAMWPASTVKPARQGMRSAGRF